MLLQAGHEVVGLDTDLFERSTFSDGIAQIPEIRKDVRDAAPGESHCALRNELCFLCVNVSDSFSLKLALTPSAGVGFSKKITRQ